jgi:hypothetical protein
MPVNACARMQDPVAGSRAGDLVKLCNEPHHWKLNQAFQAAGAPALEGGGVLGELPVRHCILHPASMKPRTVWLWVEPVCAGRRCREGCSAGLDVVNALTPPSPAIQMQVVRRCWRR